MSEVTNVAPVTTGTGAPPPGGPATTPAAPAPATLTAQPAAAPAAAPVSAPAPAPSAEPAGGFEPSGNPALDVALEFFQGHGFGPDHPAILAAEEGNFALLEAHLAVLGDKAKGSDRFVAIAKEALTSMQETAKAKATEQRKLVADSVGGEERWKAIQEWASANAEPHEREAVNKALSAGGIAAKAMAQYLANLHDSAPGTTVKPKDPVPAQVQTAPTVEPLSRQDYSAAVARLAAKIGGNLDGHPEYVALQQRREAARRLGR